MKTVIACLVVCLAQVSRAALIESDWEPSVTSGSAQLLFQHDRLDFVVPLQHVGDVARRTWSTHPTLDSDWSVQGWFHIDPLPLASTQNTAIGFSFGRQDGQPPGLAHVLMRHDGNFGRYVFAGFKIAGSVGDSRQRPYGDTNIILRLDYSASERAMRGSFRSPGGALTDLFSMSVNLWGVASGESLNLYVFGESQSVGIEDGQVTMTDFAFVPEPPLLAWLGLVPFIARGFHRYSRFSGRR
jgi:hypothetical protein